MSWQATICSADRCCTECIGRLRWRSELKRGDDDEATDRSRPDVTIIYENQKVAFIDYKKPNFIPSGGLERAHATDLNDANAQLQSHREAIPAAERVILQSLLQVGGLPTNTKRVFAQIVRYCRE